MWFSLSRDFLDIFPAAIFQALFVVYMAQSGAASSYNYDLSVTRPLQPVLPRSPHHLLLTYRRAICRMPSFDVVEIQPMSFRALLSKDLPQLSFFKDKP